MTQVAIGLVGYFQFIRGYPLGPEFMERMEATHWPEVDVSIKEMNWGPIAIVQDFQANSIKYDRIVFVTAVDRGLQHGTITCRQWLGGELDTLAIQDRIFEAVTGVISLDNLLVIGEHFKVWPQEVITIEVQLAESSFGDLVLSEFEVNRETGEAKVVGEKPLAPENEKIVEEMVSTTRKAVIGGVKALPNLYPLTANQLNPLADVCHNQLLKNSNTTTRH